MKMINPKIAKFYIIAIRNRMARIKIEIIRLPRMIVTPTRDKINDRRVAPSRPKSVTSSLTTILKICPRPIKWGWPSCRTYFSGWYRNSILTVAPKIRPNPIEAWRPMFYLKEWNRILRLSYLPTTRM